MFYDVQLQKVHGRVGVVVSWQLTGPGVSTHFDLCPFPLGHLGWVELAAIRCLRVVPSSLTSIREHLSPSGLLSGGMMSRLWKVFGGVLLMVWNVWMWF